MHVGRKIFIHNACWIEIGSVSLSIFSNISRCCHPVLRSKKKGRLYIIHSRWTWVWFGIPQKSNLQTESFKWQKPYKKSSFSAFLNSKWAKRPKREETCQVPKRLLTPCLQERTEILPFVCNLLSICFCLSISFDSNWKKFECSLNFLVVNAITIEAESFKALNWFLARVHERKIHLSWHKQQKTTLFELKCF